MKNFITLCLVALIALSTLTGCGDRGKKEFVGEWIAQIGNQKFALHLDVNGSGTASFGGNSDKINWSNEGTKIIIKMGEYQQMIGHINADRTEIKFAEPPMSFRKN